MCGRYTLACANEDALRRGLPFDEFSETRIQFRPRYNVAPGQRSPVVHLLDDGAALVDALWGLERRGGGIAVNARSESADRAPMFRDAFRDGRCLVPADGFFEWRREGQLSQPYLFRPKDGGLLLMAGLLDDGRFVVLTRDAEGSVVDIHDRMPVLLDREGAHRWLDEGVLGEGVPLTRRRVSTRVNRIEHDDEACVAPDAQESFDFD